MKALLKILVAGLMSFMLLAIGQEWEFFSNSWFGIGEKPIAANEEDRQAASESVTLMLSLMRHFYASGGDPRFADRMPASDWILQEMRSDIEYLARNGRRQDPEIKQVDVVSVELLGDQQFEVETREIWSVRFFWVDQEGESDPHQVQVLYSRYLVQKGSTGWRVEGWDFMEPPAEEAEA